MLIVKKCNPPRGINPLGRGVLLDKPTVSRLEWDSFYRKPRKPLHHEGCDTQKVLYLGRNLNRLESQTPDFQTIQSRLRLFNVYLQVFLMTVCLFGCQCVESYRLCREQQIFVEQLVLHKLKSNYIKGNYNRIPLIPQPFRTCKSGTVQFHDMRFSPYCSSYIP